MIGAYQTPAAPLRAIAEELVRAGVRDVVICPGSRSTPLALALRATPQLRCWVQLDERAGAFFALGMARASRRPTAIAVTSGTAAVGLAPALVEAHYGRVALIALTADRPAELRDRGAPQTIDQDHLFGRFAKWYAELPVPEVGAVAEAHVRSTIGRAVAVAMAAPAGPVHLDLPFREPLVPAGELMSQATTASGGDTSASGEAAHTRVLRGERRLPRRDLELLAQRIGAARRGLIVCGPLDRPGFAAAVARLAEAAGFAILADALSNVRYGPHERSHVISQADAIVRATAWSDSHQPDLVLRFGGAPTSKALLEWIAAGRAPQIVVDDGGWTEPTLLPATIVAAEPVGFAAALADQLAEQPVEQPVEQPPPGSAWLGSWRAADDAAREATRTWLGSLDEPFEGQVFEQLGTALPDGAILLAGNSMPVRDMDAFLGTGPAAVRCLGNRGANGIDGSISTALGAAAVADGPVVAVVGDVSFIHDLNALVAAARHELQLTLILVNNDGGGIFSFLPQASAARPEVGLPQHYEELFGTPHGLDFGPLVRALGASHELVSSGHLGEAVAASLSRPGVKVLELRTERARNAELHRALLSTIEQSLEPLARHSGH